MEDIINKVKEEVLKDILKFKEESDDNFDYWKEHIKYVYEESIKLAKLYNADINIVKLGALLHDIALIKKVGERKDHHINGANIGKEILDKYNIDEDVKNRVIGCIYNHRSSKNATNIEEMCVSDADILAHFDNISMLYNRAFKGYNYNLKEAKEFIKECFINDYNDLSNKTKELFKDRYNIIMDVVLGEEDTI